MIFCDTMSERDELFKEVLKKYNRISIHPYDNYSVIAGQGTIGLEICDQLDDFDAIVVPIGGGGLISGISIALKGLGSQAMIILSILPACVFLARLFSCSKVFSARARKTLHMRSPGDMWVARSPTHICATQGM